MKAICVDDKKKIVEYTASLCKRLPMIDEAEGFVRAKDALAWLDEHTADIALLDIELPDMNGIELAAAMKKRQPDLAIVFLTAFSQYAMDAFTVHASGYLLKPVNEEKLAEEVEYALAGKYPKTNAHVMVQTFGGFDVFVDGKLVAFKFAKCKELLAFLVDRQGNSVTRAEAFAILWEDRLYDRPMQKQLDGVIRSMRETLREYGIEQIFEMKRATMRICPDQFSCDAYRFFDGDAGAIHAYRGEYMNSYSWASITESYMSREMPGTPGNNRK